MSVTTSMLAGTVSKGARLNRTWMVTFFPINALGTRHECVQTPPQPNSMFPDSILPLWLSVISNVGFGGWPVRLLE